MTKLCPGCGQATRNGNKWCSHVCHVTYLHQPEQVAARFFAKVEKSEIGCWTWKGARSSVSRYGTFNYQGGNINAHRAAYIITYGPIPADRDVLHTCHNGHLACVTPHHLYLGTDAENSRDRVLVGRGFKFTAEQILEIRRKAAAGVNDHELAAEYNTVPRYIWGIRTRRNWKHLPQETTDVPA